MGDQIYLGDAVYAEFDAAIEGDVLLTTEGGYGATNTIYLEPRVIDSLLMLLAARKEKGNDNGPT